MREHDSTIVKLPIYMHMLYSTAIYGSDGTMYGNTKIVVLRICEEYVCELRMQKGNLIIWSKNGNTKTVCVNVILSL